MDKVLILHHILSLKRTAALLNKTNWGSLTVENTATYSMSSSVSLEQVVEITLHIWSVHLRFVSPISGRMYPTSRVLITRLGCCRFCSTSRPESFPGYRFHILYTGHCMHKKAQTVPVNITSSTRGGGGGGHTICTNYFVHRRVWPNPNL